MKILTLLFFVILSLSAFSQISEGGYPKSFLNKSLNPVSAIHQMPGFDVQAMLDEDAVNISEKKLIPYRFANEFDVDLDIIRDGNKTVLEDGSAIYRLVVQSPGAYSLNFVFGEYRMPQGGKLFLYNGEQNYLLGAFTEKNNWVENVLATTLVDGDWVCIEYNEPANPEFVAQLKLTKVYHAYRNIIKNWMEEKDGSYGSSGSCNINVNCPPGDDWQIQKRAVCRIVMGGGLCSGGLVANTAGTDIPYFLTANHCTGEPYANWVFNFNYEVANCTSPVDPFPNASAIPSVSGCQLRATTSQLDFCLVEMSSVPPQTPHNPFYAGWNRSATHGSTTATCIHHPSGDAKKISHEHDAPITGNYGSGYIANSHWHITAWEEGTTEGGSSGSPLYDMNKRVIGDLTGGQASCSNNVNDYYAKFNMSWDNFTAIDQQLAHWLDPSATGSTTIDGYDPYGAGPGLTANFTGVPTTITAGQTVTFTNTSTGGTPTSWNWTFEGGTPGTATGIGPHVIQYNTPGTYNAQLVISDGTNSDTELKVDYITVTAPLVLTAAFSATPTTVNVTTTATFTDATSGGTPTSWSWTFEGGTPGTATGVGPHVITYNTVGLYNASLTVSDGTSTDSESKTDYIDVIDPNAVNADFVGNPTTLLPGNTVSFTDLSTNTPTSWAWTFAGGTPATSTQQNPVITYNTVGTYAVTLTANNATSTDTETKTAYITVVDASNEPIADFIADYTIVPAGGIINFYNYSTGYYDSLLWDFPGGIPTSSTTSNPTGIVYNTLGDYDVTLILYSSLGNDTLTKPAYIHVIDNSVIDTLIADFTAITGRLIVQGWSVSYEDLTVGYPTSWQWNFQGGTPSSSTIQNPQNITYSTPGIYDVTLIVSNGISADTLVKDNYIVVTTELWPDPNGYCEDTITNVGSNERPLTFRHLAPEKWGYFPGHNEYQVKAYAEKFVNYTFTDVWGVIVPVVKAFGATSTAKVKFTVWDVDANGKPGLEIEKKEVLINSFTPYFYHTIMFDNPAPVDGQFFVGYQITYAVPADTFVVYMAPNRGVGGINTLWSKKGASWLSPSQLLGDTLNTSMAIRVLGCLYNNVDPIDWENQMVIYPNPSDGMVHMQLFNLEVKSMNVAVYDLSGRKISVNLNEDDLTNYSMDFNNLENGIYFINVNVNGQNVTKKITIVR